MKLVEFPNEPHTRTVKRGFFGVIKFRYPFHFRIQFPSLSESFIASDELDGIA